MKRRGATQRNAPVSAAVYVPCPACRAPVGLTRREGGASPTVVQCPSCGARFARVGPETLERL